MGLSSSSLRSESLQCLVTDPDYFVHTLDQRRLQAAAACATVAIATTTTTAATATQPQQPESKLNRSNTHADADERVWLCAASLLDCRLQLVCKGQLELRTSDLVFRDASSRFTWPLGSLRWYGEDAKYFVFESGRRCPSGPGLFVFKCKQSKQLSVKLGAQIHRLLYCTPDVDGLGSGQTPGNSSRHCHTTRGAIDNGVPVDLVFRTEHLSALTQANSNPAPCPGSGTCEHVSASRLLDSDDSNDYPALLRENPGSPLPLPPPPVPAVQSEPDSSICYPLLVMSAPRRLSTAPQSMIGTYLDLFGANDQSHRSAASGDWQSSFGQYLIAAAPHPYVNQPNRLLTELASAPGSESLGCAANEYVAEPLRRTEPVN